MDDLFSQREGFSNDIYFLCFDETVVFTSSLFLNDISTRGDDKGGSAKTVFIKFWQSL